MVVTLVSTFQVQGTQEVRESDQPGDPGVGQAQVQGWGAAVGKRESAGKGEDRQARVRVGCRRATEEDQQGTHHIADRDMDPVYIGHGLGVSMQA